MLDLDKMAPRCERGWMLSILTDRNKGEEEFLVKSPSFFKLPSLSNWMLLLCVNETLFVSILYLLT